MTTYGPLELSNPKYELKKNGKKRSSFGLSPRVLRNLQKKPCCEHVALLLLEIQTLIIERDHWHSQSNQRDSKIARMKKGLKW
jgi:hypothetical protein